ncbi:unnamed protein product [Lampetra fluviatilis]
MLRPVNGGRTFRTHILSWTRTGQGTEKSGSLWRGERSVRTLRRNPAGLTMGVRLLLMISLLHKLSLAKECGDGFYKSQRGICCELCPAGTYKCSSCGADEEVAHACSVAQDTVCQCMEGLKRDPGSGICLYEEHHTATTAIVLGCVLALVLSALIFSRRIRKGKWLTLKKTLEHCGITFGRDNDESDKLVAVRLNGVQGSQESGTMNLIRENEENLKVWIGVDPSHLLEHLKDYKWIPHHVYNAARKRHGDECVELILDHFFNKGEPDCKILWEALYFVRKHYLQLWRWLEHKGDAMQCVRENKSALKLWVGRNPQHLLQHLKRQKCIPNERFAKAMDMNGGEKCAELLLDYFIKRGNDDCLQLLISLQAVQDKYPEIKQFLSSLGESVRSIEEKKLDLKLWIARDPRHLLLQLMSQGRIPNRIFTQTKGMNAGDKSAEALLNYFISRGNDDCLQLLFALQAVQDEYPEVTQWLGSLVFFQRLCKKTTLFLNKYTNYSLVEKTQSHKWKLIDALHSNLTPLLSQLQSQKIFTDINVQEVKQKEQWQGSENATEYLLELFNVIRRQNVKQFWMVLWALREIYPYLEDIFEQF